MLRECIYRERAHGQENPNSNPKLNITAVLSKWKCRTVRVRLRILICGNKSRVEKEFRSISKSSVPNTETSLSLSLSK